MIYLKAEKVDNETMKITSSDLAMCLHFMYEDNDIDFHNVEDFIDWLSEADEDFIITAM